MTAKEVQNKTEALGVAVFEGRLVALKAYLPHMLTWSKSMMYVPQKYLLSPSPDVGAWLYK